MIGHYPSDTADGGAYCVAKTDWLGHLMIKSRLVKANKICRGMSPNSKWSSVWEVRLHCALNAQVAVELHAAPPDSTLCNNALTEESGNGYARTAANRRLFVSHNWKWRESFGERRSSGTPILKRTG